MASQNFEPSKTKKSSSVFLIIVVSVLVIGFFIFYFVSNSKSVDSKFVGSVASIENDTITLEGTFLNSEELPENIVSQSKFSLKMDANTKFEKMDITWPTWKEVSAGKDGHISFKVSDLPSRLVAGSLDDIKKLFLSDPWSIYVEASFKVSINNPQEPIASSIFYRLTSIPASGPPAPIQ